MLNLFEDTSHFHIPYGFITNSYHSEEEPFYKSLSAPIAPRPRIEIEPLDPGRKKIFNGFTGAGSLLDHLTVIWPVRFVKRDKLLFEITRAQSAVAKNSRRGVANHIHMGSDDLLPLLSSYDSFSHLHVKIVDYLPPNAAMLFYRGNSDMDTGLIYWLTDNGRCIVYENKHIERYGIFLIWSD